MFGKLVKIAIWVFSETNWGKVIFEEELRFSSFSYFKRKRYGPLAKKLRMVVKNDFYVSRGTFDKVFQENYTSFYHFRNMSDELATFWQKFFGRLVKIANLSVLGNLLRRGYFLLFLKRIYVLFDRFWTSSFFLRSLRRIFQYGCPNCILLVQWKGLNKNIFLWKSLFWFNFVTQVTSLGLLAKTLHQGRQKGILSVLGKERVEENQLLKKNRFFHNFRTLSENNSELWRKNFGRVAKSDFYVSKGTFREIFLRKKKHYITFTISRLWAENVRTFGKCFQQPNQNCLQNLQGSVLRFI